MNFVSVRSFDNYVYANILLLRLKEEGIDCYLRDEHTISIDPLLSPAIGGMKLMIKEADLPRVNRLLDEIEMEWLKQIPCPECGQFTLQRLVRQNTATNFFSALAMRLLHGSETTSQKTYRCSNCGYHTKELPVPKGNINS